MRESDPKAAAAPRAHPPAAMNCGFSAADLAGLTPSEIRQWVSALVADGREVLAQSLGDAALVRHPGEPDVLACGALLAQARQDWLTADELLRQWVSIQGDATPAQAWLQWVRVLRCLCEPVDALDVAIEGSRRNPDDAELAAERLRLEAWLGQRIPMQAPPNEH